MNIHNTLYNAKETKDDEWNTLQWLVNRAVEIHTKRFGPAAKLNFAPWTSYVTLYLDDWYWNWELSLSLKVQSGRLFSSSWGTTKRRSTFCKSLQKVFIMSVWRKSYLCIGKNSIQQQPKNLFMMQKIQVLVLWKYLKINPTLYMYCICILVSWEICNTSTPWKNA